MTAYIQAPREGTAETQARNKGVESDFAVECTSCRHPLIGIWCPFGEAPFTACTASPAHLKEAERRGSARWILSSWCLFHVDWRRWSIGLEAEWPAGERSIELSIGPFHARLYWERCNVLTDAIREAIPDIGGREASGSDDQLIYV